MADAKECAANKVPRTVPPSSRRHAHKTIDRMRRILGRTMRAWCCVVEFKGRRSSRAAEDGAGSEERRGFRVPGCRMGWAWQYATVRRKRGTVWSCTHNEKAFECSQMKWRDHELENQFIAHRTPGRHPKLQSRFCPQAQRQDETPHQKEIPDGRICTQPPISPSPLPSPPRRGRG
jgi:hypothetical protein